MAITKTKQLKSFEMDAENKTISVSIETIFTENGDEARKRERRAFVPGQVEDVKTWTGAGNASPYIVFLNAIWTSAVIAAYQASIAP